MSSNLHCSCGTERKADVLWSDADCHIVVTGASRGFGRALCLQLVKALTSEPGSAASVTILLMARDLVALQGTRDHMLLTKSYGSQTKLNVLVAQPTLDMNNISVSVVYTALQPLFDVASTNLASGRKQWNLLVHNAATIGNINMRADERVFVTDLEAYYRVNLIAPMVLTGVFLSHFAPFGLPHPPVTVVNISSLAAAQPFPRLSDYCVGKAARQMYLSALAVDRPTVAVFNYSPGPLDTDMYTELSEHHGDPEYKAMTLKNKQLGRLIAPEESARVCVAWLRRRHVSDPLGDTSQIQPRALVCPVHEADYKDIWRGLRLDYYDAVRMESSNKCTTDEAQPDTDRLQTDVSKMLDA
ncbi:Sepiapterin reductase [Paragonimus heterotremus]|uniref:Sepiapterin reductase n=1 Tax=Paragonimus heterotremus TaxID=100268 RepID=A0A8J4SIX8_9TREM|nr:Sepiapterin reductase [Paragonimus heterotremus]